ncbi:flagellar basal body-associated protein FliL [Sphingomonas sp.]|uniref:flagellar basal body-associated FliL family protein n=1 Tax=Sphingomonas sp. TaxID=28214 RepID=UPI001B0C67A6|nr:flagellar basal body-associated FliL family protein [Sphingomonas sp.]MBO9713933.1 flagellar basal body-associated FliL family protein [Sphingomonas sp.]
MSDTKADKPEKKKGGMMKILMLAGAALLLVGGGVGGALYAMNAGLFGSAHGGAAAAANGPQLVPKAEEKRASATKEGGHGEGGEGGGSHEGLPTPEGHGGDKYASNYYAIEKEFTSNLQDSVHFIQVGVAISTPYDDRVLDNIKTHEIAIRSAVLLALGETSEEDVFTAEGKKAIQQRLVKAINAVLQQKEGFGGVSNVYFTNFIVQ